MKKFLRPYGYVLFLAALVAATSAIGFGQDACDDAEGKTALDTKFRELYPKRDLVSRKQAIAVGKEFLEKYGSCEDVKAFADYLRVNVPKMEVRLKQDEEKAEIDAILQKFDAGLKSKNWDQVYEAGKQILAKNPSDYRAAELVLGSIGLDETAKSPRVTKWNDETLRYARQSLSDLESGVDFKSYGVGQFEYKDRNDAVGWMNATIGYIMTYDKKDKKAALPYLYKASQSNLNPNMSAQIYEAIGSYYFDEVDRLIGEVKALPQPAETDTDEVKFQKVDAIKAKVGILNGTAERALDALGRAYKSAPATEKAYRDILYKKMTDLYAVRFPEPPESLNAFIDKSLAKPMPNPTTAVTPVIDADPDAAKSTQSGSTTVPSPSPSTSSPGTKPVAPMAKPMPTAPVTKPGTGTKPQSSVKGASGSGAVAAKRGTR